MRIVVPTDMVNGLTQAPILRTLVSARDRWGRALWLDAQRWDSGRVGLTAYNRDGSTCWERGYTGRRAQVYHRANVVAVDGQAVTYGKEEGGQ